MDIKFIINRILEGQEIYGFFSINDLRLELVGDTMMKINLAFFHLSCYCLETGKQSLDTVGKGNLFLIYR